ncbi:hypothetical protein [Kitasatospora sp. CB01950]|uniref:hypothetical protein n=1 Tax=Kitasatospora sp. CB01950 TaxID=1703930 RepID=UPI000939E6FB|nr:hypothetical protein [Kitasatospora sp. CB01950]OKI95072.1 hypothetical protein AMK19_32900 [Kitasatospora sp. CB01950]
MHMPGRAPGAGGGFHPEPATATTVQEDTVTTSTLTRRPAPAPTAGAAALARHIVRATTHTAPQSWTTAEERLADEVAELTGTDPRLWQQGDLDGSATHRRLINQGAEAIIRTGSFDPAEYAKDEDVHAELEAEIAAEVTAAATRTRIDKRADRREQIRAAALEVYSEAELAAFGDDPMDAWGRDVRDQVERWSPFFTARCEAGRYVIRCKDGSRRYPDGSLAD